MALINSLLLKAGGFNVWISARTDRALGSGSVQDPFNGATQTDPPLEISLSNPALLQEALAITSVPHGFVEGGLVMISGVEGDAQEFWNGTFGISSVTERSFKYWMKGPAFYPADGKPICARLTFPFDRLMRDKIPANARINLGPGVFQTRGFAANDVRGFQPRSGWKIVGAGIDATTLQLVGADQSDKHYHIVVRRRKTLGSGF